MTANELRQQRAKLITDARALLDAKDCTVEQVTQAEAMFNDADALQKQIATVERAAVYEAELSQAREIVKVETGRSVDEQVSNREREKRILVAYALGTIANLPEADRAHFARNFTNAAGTTSGTGGGYTIAPDFQRDLLIAMKAQGGMRSVAQVIQTATGVALPWPTLDDRANIATIVSGENVQITADTDLVFGTVSMGAFTYKSGILPVSLQLLQDSAFDFDSVIKAAIEGRFVRGQNAHFTNGTGTGQPQGITTAAPVGVTGATGSTTSVTFDNIIDLIHSVDPVYRAGSSIMFHDTTLQAVRKLKDNNGRYLWQPLEDGVAGALQNGTIWGYPVVINQDMPVMAANATPIAFGDFSNYKIRDVLDMQMLVLRERFADFLQVAYLAFMRSDGHLITAAAPIKLYKNSAT